MNAEREPDEHLEDVLDEFLEWADSDDAVKSVAGLPDVSAAPASGSLGDFDLGRRLGSGGMSVVYEAVQRSVPGRRVAVKVLRSRSLSEQSSERFRREVATIGRLDHPAIVPILAADVAAGTPYYAMKYVPGISAAALIAKLKERGAGPATAQDTRDTLDRVLGTDAPATTAPDSDSRPTHWAGSHPEWAAHLALDIADALQHAYERGVVHRDVKPGNILVTGAGRGVLIDFGLASDQDFDTLTAAGDFLGTYAYASPEQLRGHEVDTRTDVYSLGATLHELLSLHRPFDAPTQAELRARIEHQDPPRLGASIPVDLATIAHVAMAKSPRRRYATPGSMAADLRHFLAGEPIAARPPSVLLRAWTLARRHPWWSASFAGALLFVLGLTLMSMVVDQAAREQANEHVRAGNRAVALARERHDELDALQAEFPRVVGLPATVGHERQLREQRASLRSQFDGSLAVARQEFARALALVAASPTGRRGMATAAALQLQRMLSEMLDLQDPPAIAAADAELQRYDDGTFAGLLETSGTVQISTTPPGAALRLLPALGAATEPIATSTTPFRRELDAGSYIAELSLADHAPVRMPFVVRRPASFVAGHRPTADDLHSLDVHLRPRREVPQGWIHVPAGWSLMGARPAHWKHVHSFLIQEKEVTLGDWLRFLRSPGYAGLPLREQKPEFEFLLHRNGRYRIEKKDNGQLALAKNESPDYVATLMPRRAAEAYAKSMQTEFEALGLSHFVDLPSSDEWERAARGADGRRFPWGNTPDRHALDVSPFGVRSLAGRCAEMTRTPAAVLGLNAIRGGIFNDRTDPDALTRSGRDDNTGRTYLGFRLVVPMPGLEVAQVDLTAEGARFEDRFDTRHPSWTFAFGHPVSTQPPHGDEEARIQDGRLHLYGGIGHYSNHTMAILPLVLPHGPVRITAPVELETRHVKPDGADRGFGMALQISSPASGKQVKLKVRSSGHAFVVVPRSKPDAKSKAKAKEEPEVAIEQPFVMELTIRDRRVEGRIWPVADRRPAQPTLLAKSSIPIHGPCQLILGADNYVGIVAKIDWLKIERLE